MIGAEAFSIVKRERERLALSCPESGPRKSSEGKEDLFVFPEYSSLVPDISHLINDCSPPP